MGNSVGANGRVGDDASLLRRLILPSGVTPRQQYNSAGLHCSVANGPSPRRKIVTWLILPVVICLSQRLSHACLSISNLYGETANGSLNQLSFI